MNPTAPVTRSTQPRGFLLRVLFLGSDQSSSSVACLEMLIDSDQCRVTAGIFDPNRVALSVRIERSLRQGGPRGVLEGVLRAGAYQARKTLRAVGIRLPGSRSLKEVVLARGIPSLTVNEINSPTLLARIRTVAPDLVLSCGCPEILGADFLKIPTIGTFNVHPSLLPRYRGPFPTKHILANGETESGVTIHFVDEGIDSGDIVFQSAFPVDPGETRDSLAWKSIQAALPQLRSLIEMAAAGQPIPRRRQDHSQASYYSYAGRVSR